jgi:hypothetical protein
VTEDPDRFDRRQAERILSRAVRESSPFDDEALSIDDLKRIANELDVPLEALDAALVAELSRTSAPPSEAGRVVPRVVEAGRPLAGPPEDVRRRTHIWLGKHEGLRLRRVDGLLEIWEKDPSLLAAFRGVMKLRGGAGRLRDLGDLGVVVAGSGEQSHVSLSAETVGPRALTAVLGSMGTVAALIGSALAGSWAWLWLGIPVLVLSVVGAVVAGRALARSLTRALEHALDGIEQGVPSTTDSVGDVIGDLRSAVESSRQGGRPGSKSRRIDIRWD